MTLHIILAIITIVFAIVAILLNLKYDNIDWLSPICIVIFLALCLFTGETGVVYHDNNHYREKHNPTIDDVNNGYAEIVEYKCISDKDTSIVYIPKWLGNNQDGEREINNNK